MFPKNVHLQKYEKKKCLIKVGVHFVREKGETALLAALLLP